MDFNLILLVSLLDVTFLDKFQVSDWFLPMSVVSFFQLHPF